MQSLEKVQVKKELKVKKEEPGAHDLDLALAHEADKDNQAAR